MAGISVYCEALRSTFLAPDLLFGGLEFEIADEIVGLEVP